MLPPPDFLYLFFEKPTFTTFIKALEQKVGFEIGLQPKTIKRALGKVKNTPQTQARLDEFSKKFAEKSGVPLFDNKHIGNAGPVYSYWPHWLALAEHTADNFPLELYPATRALIREMAYHERDKIADAYKRFDNIPERLCFFADDESKKNWVPDIIRQNLLDHCLSCNPVNMATESMCFKLWASHIMISTFLRIIAWFDVEYTQAMLKLQQKQGSPRDISFIEGLVPHQAGSNIVLPVRSLFESWKEFLVGKGRIEREWVEAGECQGCCHLNQN